jgi:hypothetical protein
VHAFTTTSTSYASEHDAVVGALAATVDEFDMAAANTNPGAAIIAPPLYSYMYLFHAISETLRQKPSKAAHNTDWESRLSTLGQQVGRCTLAQFEPPAQGFLRPVTTDEAMDFITRSMWVQWFGIQAGAKFVDTTNGDSRAYFEAPIPFVLQRANDDMHMGAFVAGMVKGVLDSSGFVCEVDAIYAEEAGVKTQFIVAWSSATLLRERRRAK